MGGVLSYSGLSTKIRAMQSRLTTMDQFEEILQLSDVTQVAAYLKRMPEYSSRWDALDENTLHRGQIEKLLKKEDQKYCSFTVAFGCAWRYWDRCNLCSPKWNCF